MNKTVSNLLISAICTSFILLFDIAPASAWLKVCNRTCDDIWYAHTYYKGSCKSGCRQPWVNVGWWYIPKGSCSTVHSGDADHHYFYYTAKSSSGRYWAGSYVWYRPNDVHEFCMGYTSCDTRTPVVGHRELYTGNDENYTLDFYY
jgi:uncharacterized membrane protein